MDKKIVFALWIIFIVIYSVNLTLLPIFEDEAEYLLLAEAIRKRPLDNFFIYPQNGLFPLFGWVAAVFNIFIKDSLIAGRIINILLASSLVWWIWFLGRLYNLPKGFSLIAILLLVTSPILLLNARVALLDTMVLVLTAWYLYFALKIVISPTKKDYFGLFITLLTALLTKATVLFGVPAIVMLIVIEIYNKKNLDKNIKLIIFICCLAFLLSGTLFLFFSQQISRDSGSSVLSHFTSESLIKRIKLNSWLTYHWTTIYYQPALIALLEYLIFFKQIKYKKLYLILGLWVVISLGVMISLNRFYYPRHILILVAPLVIFIAGIIISIPKIVSIPLFLLIMLPRVIFDWQIMFFPHQASLAAEDKFSFFEDYTSGKRIPEIARTLNNLSVNKKIILWLDGSYVMEYGLRREIKNNPNIYIKSFRLGEKFIPHNVEEVNKIGGMITYVIVNRWAPLNLNELSLVKDFPVSYRHSQILYMLR